MNNILYGIDFGTSNSAVSIIDLDSNTLLKTFSIPSVLYFPQNPPINNKSLVYVGKEAVETYVSDGLKGRFMKSLKRILPNKSFDTTLINGTRYDASDLVSKILIELKHQADSFVGHSVTNVILGRPVFFDDDDSSKDELAQKRLERAAILAGFNTVHFQFEPIAAAFTYEKNINIIQKVLVADLGGGTTDFTFIELDPSRLNHSDRRKDILATGGIYIGGDSFDSAFMWNKGTVKFGRGVKYESKPGTFIDPPMSLFLNITTWERMIFFNSVKVLQDLRRYYFLSKNNPLFKNLITLIENNLGYSVFREIEQTKIDLTAKDETVFSFHKDGIEIEETVSIEEYNSIIEADIKRISQYVDSFLASNKIDPSMVDSVFLTGGTSLVPAVQKIFSDRFGKEKLHSGDNFISVANGLAYSHYLMHE
jgi:hypothetical chaperone protein